MQKIIHYFYDNVNIWEKNTSPGLRMCYASWKKFCPDYEIKLWHIGMPEFQQMLKDSKFLRLCYKRKIWAFIADYIRHYALYNYGGVYLDTDVQLVKSLDEFLNIPFFVSIEGDFYNRQNIVESAVMGGEKGYIIFKDILDIYNSDEVFNINYPIAPVVLTEYLRKKCGFKNINYSEEYKSAAENYYKNTEAYQLEDYKLYKNQQVTELEGVKGFVYPSEYFCPTWAAFGERAFTENTVAIHWNQSSWWTASSKLRLLESYRYKNLFKRFLYRNSERFAKMLTFWIPNKLIRKSVTI